MAAEPAAVSSPDPLPPLLAAVTDRSGFRATTRNAVLVQADARAFAALMRHIRQVDRDQTVIMIQVENESGLLGDSRDRSALANTMWSQPVPAVLVQADARAVPIADGAIRLIVSSPRYNVAWPYLACDDDTSLDEYTAELAAILREHDRVLVPGGTLAWVVPPTTRRSS